MSEPAQDRTPRAEPHRGPQGAVEARTDGAINRSGARQGAPHGGEIPRSAPARTEPARAEASRNAPASTEPAGSGPDRDEVRSPGWVRTPAPEPGSRSAPPRALPAAGADADVRSHPVVRAVADLFDATIVRVERAGALPPAAAQEAEDDTALGDGHV